MPTQTKHKLEEHRTLTLMTVPSSKFDLSSLVIFPRYNGSTAVAARSRSAYAFSFLRKS